jgi:hypothetical protein
MKDIDVEDVEMTIVVEELRKSDEELYLEVELEGSNRIYIFKGYLSLKGSRKRKKK